MILPVCLTLCPSIYARVVPLRYFATTISPTPKMGLFNERVCIEKETKGFRWRNAGFLLNANVLILGEKTHLRAKER